MKWLKLALGIIVSAALAVSPARVSAQTVMTFGPISCAGVGAHGVPSPYMEAGFTLSTSVNAFATECADAPGYAGPGMFINTFGATASLTKTGGGLFSINGIDLAHLFAGSYPAGATLTFTGFTFGGGILSQTFTLGAQASTPFFEAFLFNDAWTNLTLLSVGFPSQDLPYQFSNIRLDGTTIPEPASITLLGTGLVGVFGAARRRWKTTSAP